MKHSTCRLTVRGYELDSFGHVNNAVYLQYAETALWNFMKIHQLMSVTDTLFPVVMESTQRYLHELKLFDEIRIESDFSSNGSVLVCEHKIYHDGTGILSCRIKGKVIFVSRDRIMHDVPEEIMKILEEGNS